MNLNRALALSFLTAIGLLAAPGALASDTAGPSIQLRVQDNQLQIGTEVSAPYYIQWRTPDGTWQIWTSGTEVPSEISGFWLRGVFQPEDPTWEIPADVGRLYEPYAPAAQSESQGNWTLIGTLGSDGQIAVAPAEALMDTLPCNDSPAGSFGDATPRNNQAQATPMSWQGNFYWVRSSDNRTAIWRVMTNGAQTTSLAPFDGGAAGYTLRYITDLNNDGTPDLLWTRDSDNRTVGWMLEQDGYISEYKTMFTGGAAGYTLRVAIDLNSDGIKDLVWTRDSDNRTVGWLMNAGGDIVSNTTIYAGGAAGYTLRAAVDLNDDSVVDLVWTRNSDNRTVGWLLDASGAITSYQTIYAGGAPGYTFRGMYDLNNDSTLDMVWTRDNDNRTLG